MLMPLGFGTIVKPGSGSGPNVFYGGRVQPPYLRGFDHLVVRAWKVEDTQGHGFGSTSRLIRGIQKMALGKRKTWFLFARNGIDIRQPGG